MPMFEYHCKRCEHRFEKFVRRWDEKTICPRCHTPAEKLLSRFSVGASNPAPGAAPPGLQMPMCTKC